MQTPSIGHPPALAAAPLYPRLTEVATATAYVLSHGIADEQNISIFSAYRANGTVSPDTASPATMGIETLLWATLARNFRPSLIWRTDVSSKGSTRAVCEAPHSGATFSMQVNRANDGLSKSPHADHALTLRHHAVTPSHGTVALYSQSRRVSSASIDAKLPQQTLPLYNPGEPRTLANDAGRRLEILVPHCLSGAMDSASDF